jgi:putative ABC transport system permease protein
VTRRAPAGVATAFAIIAILLSGLGVYGLLASTVSQRTSEIGVRMALGATRGTVARLILSHLGLLTAVAVGVGIALALQLGRLVNPLLAEVDAASPGLPCLAAAIVVGVALVAASIPIGRATRVDPSTALRAE